MPLVATHALLAVRSYAPRQRLSAAAALTAFGSRLRAAPRGLRSLSLALASRSRRIQQQAHGFSCSWVSAGLRSCCRLARLSKSLNAAVRVMRPLSDLRAAVGLHIGTVFAARLWPCGCGLSLARANSRTAVVPLLGPCPSNLPCVRSLLKRKVPVTAAIAVVRALLVLDVGLIRITHGSACRRRSILRARGVWQTHLSPCHPVGQLARLTAASRCR